jgi:hypothetical protein
VFIALAWWHDDYKAATRSIKHSKTPLLNRDPKIISEKLETCFSRILKWKFGSWTSRHKGYERIWHTMPQKQFEADALRYPIPKYVLSLGRRSRFDVTRIFGGMAEWLKADDLKFRKQPNLSRFSVEAVVTECPRVAYKFTGWS